MAFVMAISRGRDVRLEPPQQSDPLNYFVYPYAEADGKPLPVHWHVRYTLITFMDR